MPTCYSQRDIRWSRERLGTAKDSTIGKHGCLISAVASVLTDFGIQQTPLTLNRWLTANRGYVCGNMYVWRSVEALGVEFVQYIACDTIPAPIAKINDALASGLGVVAKVDFSPGGATNMHFVRLLSLKDGRGGEMIDPWKLPGHETDDLSIYLKDGWDNARGIFGVGIYRKAIK